MTQPPIQDAELDRATDPEYAAVSVTAVLGVILAVLSVVAFLVWPLVVVPVLAVGVSLLARQRIRRSHGVLTGRRLALGGLALGLGMLVASGGYHGWRWLDERRSLGMLNVWANALMDQVLAKRYKDVFDQMPPDTPQRKQGFDFFRDRLNGLFADAGAVRGCRLRSLQLLKSEGKAVALAEVDLSLEQRVLRFQLWFQPDAEGRWQFVGLGGRETLQSELNRGTPGPPPLFGPYERGAGL